MKHTTVKQLTDFPLKKRTLLSSVSTLALLSLPVLSDVPLASTISAQATNNTQTISDLTGSHLRLVIKAATAVMAVMQVSAKTLAMVKTDFTEVMARMAKTARIFTALRAQTEAQAAMLSQGKMAEVGAAVPGAMTVCQDKRGRRAR